MSAYLGLYIGKVIRSEDNGVCKVHVPGVFPDDLENMSSHLPDCMPLSPLFGAGIDTQGLTGAPSAGAHVAVMFLAGDQMKPFYFALAQGSTQWLAEHVGQWKIKTKDLEVVVDDFPGESMTFPSNSSDCATGAPTEDLLATVHIKAVNGINVEIEGACNVLIKGNAYVQVDGDSCETIKGNLYRKIEGDVVEELDGSYKRTVATTITDTATGAVAISGSTALLSGVTGASLGIGAAGSPPTAGLGVDTTGAMRIDTPVGLDIYSPYVEIH